MVGGCVGITLKMSSPCCAIVYPESGPPKSRIAFFLSSSSIQLIMNVAGDLQGLKVGERRGMRERECYS